MRQTCLHIFFVVLLFIIHSDGFSQQLKLGKNPSAVIKSAVLELESSNQGLLFPRLTDTASINLLSPPDGMVIYLISAKQLYVRSNGRWSVLTSGTIDTTNIPNFYLKVRGLHSASAPVTYNSTTGAIGITQASSTTPGYLSAADWTRFNNLTLGWSRTGDAGTNSSNNFIGTTDAQDLVFRTDNIERWRIQNTTGDIKIGDATSGTFKATKELVMRQDGDTYGSSILRLRNRNAENGAIFETTTTDPGATLVDFIFKTSVNQRNIRFESRPTYSLVGVPAFHIGGSNPDVPNLAIGDVYSAFNTKLKIGNYTTATEMLDVAGNVKFSGALMPNNIAGTSGYFLQSNGTNTAPTWVSLSYLSDPGANGILARTASNTITNRTLTGTNNRLTISNGDGVSGNPTFDISSSYIGQSSITTLGTIGTGIWQGTAISEAYGGTDQTTYTKGDILYASATNTLTKLNIGTAGEHLVVKNGVPIWESPATYQTPTPANPGTNNSSTAKMMGLAGSITPTISGKVMIIISGDTDNGTVNSGSIIQIRYNTGTAPTNGVATTGTAAGSAITMVSNNANNRMPFTCNAVVTMTVGATYWIDLSLAAVTNSTVARIRNVSISAVEL